MSAINKENCFTKNIFWLFDLVTKALRKNFFSQYFRFKYSPSRLKLCTTKKYDMTQYDEKWYENSNIDFKWKFSKIITPTLIAKISIEDSKSLLFLHFLNRRKNFNYADDMAQIYFICTSTFLLLIFSDFLHWYEHIFAFAFSTSY